MRHGIASLAAFRTAVVCRIPAGSKSARTRRRHPALDSRPRASTSTADGVPKRHTTLAPGMLSAISANTDGFSVTKTSPSPGNQRPDFSVLGGIVTHCPGGMLHPSIATPRTPSPPVTSSNLTPSAAHASRGGSPRSIRPVTAAMASASEAVGRPESRPWGSSKTSVASRLRSQPSAWLTRCSTAVAPGSASVLWASLATQPILRSSAHSSSLIDRCSDASSSALARSASSARTADSAAATARGRPTACAATAPGVSGAQR